MNKICGKLTPLICVISIVLTTFGSTHARPASAPNPAPRIVSDAVVLEWNQIAFETIPPQPPFPANRWMAIVQVAVFEAVNATTDKYRPYLGTISAPEGSSPEAAAIMAAHNVLVAYFPAQAAVLDQRRDASLASIPDGQAKIDGIGVGMAAAAAMVANRANDGSSPSIFHMPTNSDPYEWQVYPGCPAGGGAFKHWQNVRPFAMDSASQFRSGPPPALWTGMYAQDFNELQAVGSLNSPNRPQHRTDVVRLYAIYNPPALWNSALLQIASTRNDEITDTARTMALMNIAVTDGAVANLETKYFYRTWRPITAIPRGGEDGNRRTIAGPFTPLIQTPCFPSYPSAHGTLSNAARQVLEREYGRFGHSITFQHPTVPGVILNYSDLREITDDISDARVYGGIHFRFDQDAGELQGEAVAQHVYNHMFKRKRVR
ncbi:MAG: vanadium-dependent haloperoxidase [Acidobacteria bacterium]|nr:vanadium-dependent haloperoxidase [Acidobacteriota bacterium]